MPTTNEEIDYDFKVSSHEMELNKATDIIVTLKEKVLSLQISKLISDRTHSRLYEEVATILDYVGKLSEHVFDIQDKLEVMYTMKYKHAPALGKVLGYKHYERLHHPYTLLKNRCFTMFEQLDKLYIEVNGGNPPNWKI